MDSEPAKAIQAAIQPWLDTFGFAGFVVLNPDAYILAATHDDLVGQQQLEYVNALKKVLAGKPLVSRPFPSLAKMPDEKGGLSSGVPTMFAAPRLQ